MHGLWRLACSLLPLACCLWPVAKWVTPADHFAPFLIRIYWFQCFSAKSLPRSTHITMRIAALTTYCVMLIQKSFRTFLYQLMCFEEKVASSMPGCRDLEKFRTFLTLGLACIDCCVLKKRWLLQCWDLNYFEGGHGRKFSAQR